MSYFKRTLMILIVIAAIAFGLFIAGINLFTDWLWFNDLHFGKAFITVLMAKVWVRIVVGVLFALFVFINLLFTRKKILQFFQNLGNNIPFKVVGREYDEMDIPTKQWITKGKLNLLFFIISVVVGFLTGSISTGAWETVLKYLNQTPFGVTDPIFHKDIGFYVFQLPLFQLLYSHLTGLVVLTGIIVALVYILLNIKFGSGRFQLQTSEKLHIATLAVLFFALKAFGYFLQMYQLLYSSRGVVFGAGYTDIHVELLAYRVLTVVVAALALFTLINIFTRKMKLIYIGVALWLLVAVVLGSIYPGIIQKYQVEPNEINLESPYIKNNIDYTLKAYNLEKLEERPFAVSANLTADDLTRAEEVIQNIRLWDWRPLQKTYSQLQELRLYYDIAHVDIDRYMINGTYRQVMVGPRELNLNGLEARAQTWINQTLKFTHGMGVVMSPVNVVTPEGMPEFFVKNIPPISTVNEIKITQPRIYYGENTNNYVIANTKSGEFDYTGVTNYYDGKTGIALSSIWRKLAFAIKYSNLKILLSSDISAESKVLYDRNIMTRVSKLAPYLKYDKDPYMVVADGKLYWMIDAYTTTNMYPYAEPTGDGYNYIRNSVKVVVDAYNGNADFYISDPTDPIIQTYAKIFSDVYKPLKDMPATLQEHIRYPEDMFNIQSQIYTTYHMKNPVTFFNKEDQWNIPTEKYGGETVQVQPYYILTRLPGEDDLEFIQMLPFTPATKNNMVSWLVAKSDPKDYGKLVLYTFPKDRTIYGPSMIEARIDQDSVISQQLTLWDQKGSSVIRGNLLTLPIKNSILYVEPIFLQSQQTQLPELKRVVVAFGDEVVMEPTLQEAFNRIFGTQSGVAQKDQALDQLPKVIQGQGLSPLAKRAAELFDEAQARLKAGDFAGFGTKLQELGKIIEDMQTQTK